MPLGIGERFGDYVVAEILRFDSGFGDIGFGKYDSGRAFAIKVLKEGASADARTLFEQEVDILEKARGPHLASLIASDTKAPRPFLVLERLGAQIEDSIPVNGFSRGVVLNCVRQTSEALAAIAAIRIRAWDGGNESASNHDDAAGRGRGSEETSSSG